MGPAQRHRAVGRRHGTSRGQDRARHFSYARIVEAARRYHDCRKAAAQCKLIVSGGNAAYHGDARSQRLPRSAGRAGRGCRRCAARARQHEHLAERPVHQRRTAALRRRPCRAGVLGIHLKRSALYFAHFGVAATPVRADYLHARRSVVPLSYNFAVAGFRAARIPGHRALPRLQPAGLESREDATRPGLAAACAWRMLPRVGIHSQRPCVQRGMPIGVASRRRRRTAHSGVVKAMARRITPHIQPSECAEIGGRAYAGPGHYQNVRKR